jgi:hypothetical protein
MIEVLWVASINPAHSKCKQRRPALKKNATSPVRPKKTRQTASNKATAKLTVGIDLGDLAMLRARDALVQVRTKLMNCARGMVKSVGGRLPGASGECFAKRVREHVPDAIRDALTPVLDQIEVLATQLDILGSYGRKKV